MAALSFSAIAAALNTLFDNEVQMAINRAVVLTSVLDATPGNGKNITWDVRTGTATPAGAVIADGADVSVYNSDNKVPALLNYGTYHDAFSITGKAIAAAKMARGPAELMDLFGAEIMESATRLASAIGVHSYTGDGSTDTIHGLYASDGPLSATGTYAAIVRGTHAQWASNVSAGVGGADRPLTVALMRELKRLIYVASGKYINLIVTDPIQFEKYGLLMDPQRRYLSEINVAGKTVKLDAGFGALEFDGIPVIQDVNHPAGSMSFINTNFLKYRYLPTPADAVNQARGSMMLAGTPEAQYGARMTGIPARIQPLAITGDAYKFALYAYPQLQASLCNVHGSLVDLSS